MRMFLAALGVVWSMSAQAQPASDMARMIDESLRWIAANSDYRYDDMKPAPSWAELTVEQLRVQAGNLGINGDPTDIVGVYICEYRAFYYNSSRDPQSLLSQSFVVHEMVHHGQCMKRRFMNDDCAAEKEAYLLQAKWLQDQIPNRPRSKDWIVKTAAQLEKVATSPDRSAAGFGCR